MQDGATFRAVSRARRTEPRTSRVEMAKKSSNTKRTSPAARPGHSAAPDAAELLHSVLGNAPLILWAVDGTGRVVLCEGGGLSALGLTQKQVLGRSVFELASGREDVLDPLRRALAGNNVVYEIGPLAGGLTWWEVRLTPLRGTGGKITGVVGVYTDITERKQAVRRANAVHSLLGLFAKKTSRKEYLNSAVGVLQRWSGCRCVGIRVVDEKARVPYEAFVGFDRTFWQKENWLSLEADHCACTRVIAGTPEPQDRMAITPAGSFFAPDLSKFLATLTPQQVTRYRGTCLQSGFRCIAIIPIRYREQTFGAIHLADERPGVLAGVQVEFIEEILAPLIAEAIYRFNAQQEIRRNQELLESMFDNIHLGLAHLDREFRFLRVNRAYAQSTGQPTEFFIGKKHFDLYPDPENESIFRQVVETGRPVTVFEKPFVYPDHLEWGTTYWDWTLYPIKDESGEVESLVLALLNVTERHRALERLRESEERFRQMAETVPEVIWIASSDLSQVQFVNRAYERLYGRTCQSLYDDASDWLRAVHQEDRSAVESFVQTLSDPEKPSEHDLTYRIVQPQGEIRWVNNRFLDIRTPDGKVARRCGITADITEQKIAEEKLRHYNTQLRSLSSQLTLLEENERRRIATLLHDGVCQTLALAKIRLGLLTRSGAGDFGQAALEEVMRLVDESIRQARSLTFELASPALHELGLPHALEQLAEQARAQLPLSISCRVEPLREPAPKDIAVILYQGTRELLYNAAKHAQASQVKLSMDCPDGTLRVIVQDDGIGFDPASVRPFRYGEGGFGLFNIRERLEHFGGHLQIESQVGRGTRITMTVPLRQRDEQPAKEAAQSTPFDSSSP